MDNILLLDTSIATDNIGDDIIMECTRKELAPILSKSFVRNLPTHVSPFHWYQVWRKSNALMSFANSKLKFVGGSNILIPNLLTHYPQWNINMFNYQPLKGCILVGVGAGAGAEYGSNWYTRHIYRNLLNSDYYHSARDERSKKYMEYLGKKAINTGCVTMWMFTPEFCKTIPTKKANKVVFTLTDDDFSEPFDARLFEKLKFDGMNEENFAWIKDQSLNKVGLTKLALQHCDGVVQATEHVSEEILALVKESGLPFLPYQSDVMKNADAMKAFYESL